MQCLEMRSFKVELILMLLHARDAAKGHVDKLSSSTFT